MQDDKAWNWAADAAATGNFKEAVEVSEKQPIAYVTMGMPACGKSTLVKDLMLVTGPNVFYNSTDDYIEKVAEREGLTYSDVFKREIKAATEVMARGLEEALEKRQDVIWDQTNLSRKKRARILNQLTKAGYTTVLYDMHPKTIAELQIVLDRMKSRPGKVIPPYVIVNMLESYEEPSQYEGWDKVFSSGIYRRKDYG